MKLLRTVALLIVIALMVSCQMPGSNLGDSDISDIDESELTIIAENIGTIGSYGYSNSSSAASKNFRDIGLEILSYAEPGSNEFKPIVFKTANGTKVIFQNPKIKDLGNGYYFCEIGNLTTIRKEPTIIYEPTGKMDELGNAILKQKTVIIDVEQRYGSNYSIIDMDNSTACLFSSLGGDDSIQVNYDYGFFQTNDAFYFQGTGSKGDAVFQMMKRELGAKHPTVREMTNPSVFSLYDNEGASDKVILVKDTKFVPYVIDTEAHLSPTRILPDDYVYVLETQNGIQDEIRPFTVAGNSTCSTVYDDYVYSFAASSFRKFVGGVSLKVNEGVLEEVGQPHIAVDEDRGLELEKISATEKNSGIELIMRQFSYDNGYYTTVGFARAFCQDGNVDLSYLPMPHEYRASDKFAVLDGKVYWIGNVNVQSGSSICCGDFDAGTVNSTIIPGKPAASSEFSLSPDGSIVYWQYLSDVDVGTYSWNPEKEDVPRLLMTTKGDVHSIINIDSL